MLLIAGCGIESTIPTGTAPPSETERAVTISSVVVSGTGSTVTCELNAAIVSPDVTIPLFLEFENNEVQRVNLVNQSTYTFNEYNPPANGMVKCVVEFANAEFESEANALTHLP